MGGGRCGGGDVGGGGVGPQPGCCVVVGWLWVGCGLVGVVVDWVDPLQKSLAFWGFSSENLLISNSESKKA